MASFFQNKKSDQWIIFLFSIFLIIICFISRAYGAGDGTYYYAQLVGFYEHGFPHISDQVKDIVLNRLGANPQEALASVGRGDRIYSWHFWFYSLVCLPAFLLLTLFDIDGLKAFQFTNAFLIIFAIFYIFSCNQLSRREKWFISAIYFLSSGIAYIFWPHPEIYSSALLIVACCELLKRRYVLVALFVALASYQNPSIALFMFPVYFYQLFFDYWKEEKGRLVGVSRRFLPTFFVSFLFFVPYIWNYAVFGTFNPIAEFGYINYDDIGFFRLLSLIFDLNQGFVVALPGVLAATILLVLYRCYRLVRYRESLQFIDIFLVAFFLMAAPVLSQLNWNPGQSVYLRYICWLSIPIIFWVAVLIRPMRLAGLGFGVVAGLQLVWMLLIFMQGGFYLAAHVTYKPWVPLVWRAYPALYNPAPEIFHERLHGREEILLTPSIYIDHDNNLVKILTKANTIEAVAQEVCGEQGYLQPVSSRWANQLRLHATEHDYYYLTGKMRCHIALPSSISAASNSLITTHLHNGWAYPEEWGVWSMDSSAALDLGNIDVQSEAIRLFFDAQVYVSEQHSTQRIQLSINGKDYGSWQVQYPDTEWQAAVTVDVAAHQAKEPIVLQFTFPDAASPHELGVSSDQRRLALGLRRIDIEAVTESQH